MAKKIEITGYELSRNWFDWCYENPELITPTHTAMYFFIIEHWNRMGQKDKFGLPSEMTKDALGIKNYKTFAKAFNDLIDWGFIKLIQKSKNQYSSNIIALVKNTKANTKALTKASLKHVPKQVQRIVGIFKPNNLITLEPNNTLLGEKKNEKNWRDDFEVYKENVRNGYREIMEDEAWFKKQSEFYPNVNILKSIEKSCVNFWITEAGWKNKKKAKTETINWKLTFANAISQPQNKVYYDRNTSIQQAGNYQSGANTRRNDAQERRASVENLKNLADRILQQP